MTSRFLDKVGASLQHATSTGYHFASTGYFLVLRSYRVLFGGI